MDNSLIQIIFYVFASLAVFSALMVISQNNPVRCVLFLVLTFVASSVLWILAQAEFLALILVLVYVGAVMTLFLFVVMMLNIDVESRKSHFFRYLPMSLIVVGLLTALMLTAMPKDSLATANTADMSAAVSNTEALGLVLYTDYFLAFEMAAALLLVAIIASITLVHRGPRGSKRQNIREQIMTRAEDRVELINMKSEK